MIPQLTAVSLGASDASGTLPAVSRDFICSLLELVGHTFPLYFLQFSNMAEPSCFFTGLDFSLLLQAYTIPKASSVLYVIEF
jgi:hypothetical protein